MPSDLVIVYHRQPYEEVEENGKTVFRENKIETVTYIVDLATGVEVFREESSLTAACPIPLEDCSGPCNDGVEVTNERAIMLVHGRKTFIRSFSAAELAEATPHIEPDGSGDIWFCPDGKRARLNAYIGLEAVEDVLSHIQDIRAPITQQGSG